MGDVIKLRSNVHDAAINFHQATVEYFAALRSGDPTGDIIKKLKEDSKVWQ